MHYYSHNIGDYRKDTAHLSLLEHGIYRQLLDSYYLDETPLTNDLAKLMRSHSVRNADEQQALQNVLTDFFELTEKGYVHKRCEEGIAAFHGKSESARRSANFRWASKNNVLQSEPCERNTNALQSESEGNANHKPITKNHKPITNKKLTPADADDGFDEFWSIYERKGTRKLAYTRWKKINPSVELQLEIYDAARAYVQATPEVQYRKNAETWLNNECWNDKVFAKPKQVGFFGTVMSLGDTQNEQLPAPFAKRLDG